MRQPHPSCREVEILNFLGKLFVAIPLEERVVKVLALRSHAADVERRASTTKISQCRCFLLGLGDRCETTGEDLHGTERSVSLGHTSVE